MVRRREKTSLPGLSPIRSPGFKQPDTLMLDCRNNEVVLSLRSDPLLWDDTRSDILEHHEIGTWQVRAPDGSLDHFLTKQS